jgi:PAS domain S-box-containing protein
MSGKPSQEPHPPGLAEERPPAELQGQATKADLHGDQALLHELQVHRIELQQQNEELRRAQILLEESRSRYSDLYHHAPVGYVVLDRSGIIVESNATFAAMLDLECPAVNGRVFADLMVDEDGAIFRSRLRSFFKQPAAKHIPLRLRRSSRHPIHIELSGSPLPGGEQLLVTITDITARRRLETKERLLSARVKQLDKEASLSRLAGAVAHNFNNMLAVILGNLELALEMLPLGEVPLKELRDAQQAGQRAAETAALIRTYLGQARVHKVPVDLAAVCDSILPAILKTKPAEVAIACNFSAATPQIAADGEQLRQLIGILTANAFEALHGRPGRVLLSLSLASHREIARENRFPLDWEGEPQQAYACLTVDDDGCGIPPEELPLIFDPFYTTKFPGRGMGLPVVLGILRGHDGCITVESRSGSGSRFCVYLPATPASEADQERAKGWPQKKPSTPGTRP